MRILITGATGLLGNNVARLAIAQGMRVVTLSRSGRDSRALSNLDIETIQCDLGTIRESDVVQLGVFDAIIHCAAHIHIGWKFMDEAMRINRDGTEALLRVAQKNNTRFIHVSTVNTLPVGSKTQPADEDTQGDGQVPCTYVLSKRAAEASASKAQRDGLPVIFVHPGFMLGPWDWKPSSGRMICELQKNFAPLAPSGGCSVCDPRDVAAAILQSITRGVSGRHYILAGENLTYLDLWRRICNAVGKSGPWTYMRLPAKVISSYGGDLFNKFSRGESEINSAAIAMASQFHWYSSQRAIAELGYHVRPVNESIRDAVDWFRANGILPPATNTTPPLHVAGQS